MDFIDETILTTPTPNACSTETKSNQVKQGKKINIPFELEDGISVMSEGDMEWDNLRKEAASLKHHLTIPGNYQRHTEENYTFNETLLKQRKKAIETLQKPTRLSITRTYKSTEISHTAEESTVNESDLLNFNKSTTQKHEFSKLLEEIELLQENVRNRKPLSDTFNKSNLENEKPTRDVSATFGNNSSNFECTSSLFNVVQNPQEQILADELSWRQKYNLPVQKNSISFQPNETANKLSMGEFFQKKSDECSSIFETSSPQKREPIPLLNSTTYSEASSESNEPDYSKISTSLIKQFLTNETLESPNKFLEKMMNKGVKRAENKKERYSKLSSIGNIPSPLHKSKQFASSNDLMNYNSKNLHMNKLQSAKSLNNVANKENIGDKSMSSIRTASSMDTLPDGKLPIAGTVKELVWGCLKVGRIESTKFELKNRFSKNLTFQVVSSNPNFNLGKADSDLWAPVVTTIKKFESQMFTVNFQPIHIGPHIGKLIFTPLIHGELSKTHRQIIMMYGYGGNTNVDIIDIDKDVNGKRWLSYGILHNSHKVSKYFSIKNSGTIPGFAFFTSTTDILHPLGTLEVIPSKIVLQPEEVKRIEVNFTPNRFDFKDKGRAANSSHMIQIGKITAITGAENIRGRLKKMVKLAAKQNLYTDKTIDMLCDTFEGECTIDELKLFKEDVDSIKTLYRHLESMEVSITMEHDPDKTLIPDILEESSIYHTLICNDSNITMLELKKSNFFKVEPAEITLILPHKTCDNLVLTSSCKDDVNLDINVEPNVLTVKPKSGILKAGEVIILKVAVNVHDIPVKSAQVRIRCQDELLFVNVKFIQL